MKKNVKCRVENFAQGFRLCIVFILIQHDQKNRKPTETIVYIRISAVSEVLPDYGKPLSQ